MERDEHGTPICEETSELDRLCARVAELEGTIKCLEETAAENSRVHVEMHNTIQALNEENANLAAQLRRLENPD